MLILLILRYVSKLSSPIKSNRLSVRLLLVTKIEKTYEGRLSVGEMFFDELKFEKIMVRKCALGLGKLAFKFYIVRLKVAFLQFVNF